MSATSPSVTPVDPVIRVRDLARDYPRPRQRLLQPAPVVQALRGVSLDVAPGETLGVVGESGCGKSTLLRIVAGLDRATTGTVEVDGRDITRAREHELRWLRRRLQVVFQDPMSSLDPRHRIGTTVAEPLHALGLAGGLDVPARVAELLSSVGLDPDAAQRFPHQFSGGQRQRIAIARALAPAPGILLADEPVSALDVSVRAQVLGVLEDLVRELSLTLVLVSHDLTVVRHVCSRVVVMHAGEIVEQGPTEQVYADPQADYTRRLVTAVPTVRRALAGVTAADLAGR